jgi:SRSO17 transposase
MLSGGQAAEYATRHGLHDLILTELCSALFSSFARRDQRRKGIEYLHGLLRASGRKSIRQIAMAIGGQATEQYLHHFISDSTWDCLPVRRALAGFVGRVATPNTWVIRPMVIPKAGEHSVGVDRRFCPDLGQTLNAQQAMGVWAASDEVTVPVNWRLHLSRAWVADAGRRNRAAIPEDVRPETMNDCAIEAFLDTAARADFPTRRVVMDARGTDVHSAVARLSAAGAPLLMRISGTQPFVVADPNLPGHSPDPQSAQQIMGTARDLRRPFAGRWPSLAATVRVCLPGAPRNGELVLLGVSPASRPWPAELWLSNQPTAHPADLLRTSRFIDRVDHDFARFADRVGIRDFTGRSFAGWHRHVTLASAAHAVVALADTTSRHRRPWPVPALDG